MTKYKHIIKEGRPFLNAHATQEEIKEAGRKIICLIYDEKSDDFDLNDVRLKKFEQNVIKSINSVNVHKLPPTNSAAKYHTYRVYYQVQVWLRKDTLEKTKWGWELTNGNFFLERWIHPQHHKL